MKTLLLLLLTASLAYGQKQDTLKCAICKASLKPTEKVCQVVVRNDSVKFEARTAHVSCPPRPRYNGKVD